MDKSFVEIAMRKVMAGSISLLLLAQLPAMAAPACTARSGPETVPLVELYTSEGCSSCPPADRWFSQQASSHAVGADANWLAFHVDYWDSIGWSDRFASATYSQRQRARVSAGGGSTVYTPQVMVGTQVQTPWHAGIGSALRQARTPSAAGLALQLQPAAKGWQVALGASRASSAPAGDAQVWLAQYSDDQDTQVRAGENAGVKLHHDRVVRHLWGPWPLNGTAIARQVTMAAPSPRWGVTAFVQDAQGRVWQSLNLPFGPCG
jgi:hypothetical protein